MKIAMVVGVFPALSETFVLHQVTGLLELAYDVQIISFCRPDEDVMHPEVREYDLLTRTHYLDLPTSRTERLRAFPPACVKLFTQHALRSLTATRVMRRRMGLPRPHEIILTERLVEAFDDCDLIHCHFGYFGLDALAAALITAKPLAVTFHGNDVGAYIRAHGRECYRDLFHRAAALMCVSNDLRDRVLQLGAPPERTVLQYISSSLNDVPCPERVVHDSRPIHILTVARLIEKKGIEYSLEAVQQLVTTGIDVKYWIVGDGPLRKKLSEWITAAGLDERVTLHGLLPRPEVLRLFERADLFLLTSVTAESGDTEGMPVVIREAHAAGLPVITTAHSGNPGAIEDGVTGFAVPERDVDALVERLRFLIENQQLWPEMGRAGRRFVEERFDLQKLNRRLTRIYENIIADLPPGSGLAEVEAVRQTDAS